MNREDDLEYLKTLNIAQLSSLADDRLVKITSLRAFDEWLLPTDGGPPYILWTPMPPVTSRFMVHNNGATPVQQLVTEIKSITFHEGLEIRPVLKIED